MEPYADTGMPNPRRLARRMWRLAAAVLLAACAGLAGAAPDPAWRATQAAGTWKAVSAARLADVDPAATPKYNPDHPAQAPWHGTGGQAAVMAAWGGGAFDDARSTLWIWGGGHGNYAGNEVYSMDLAADSPVFRLRRAPTGAVGNRGVLDDRREAHAVYFDGRPRSTHSYGNLAVDAAGNLWAAPNDGLYASGGQNAHAFRFNAATGDWDVHLATAWSPTDMTGSSVYVPTRNEIVMIPASLGRYARFDPDTLAVTLSPRQASGNPNQALFDPLRNAVIIFAPAAVKYLDMALPDIADQAPLRLSAPPPADNGGRGWAYDAANDRYVTWDGEREAFLTLTPPPRHWRRDTWTYGAFEPARKSVLPPRKAASGTWGRFFHSTSLRGFGLVNSTRQAVYFYALDDGSAVAPGH
ncbi:MAG: hypothetical protein AB1831_09015 [Pseudomonadota bacterium]